MSACTGTPVSWLRLERYHLGELAESEREEIRAHLDACEACAACLGRIAEDDARELPPLPAPTEKTAEVIRPARWRGRTIAIASGLALAAGVLLAIGRTPAGDDEARTKGSDVSLSLVQESGGLVPEAGGLYREGDRFKVLVTCPPGMRATFDVAVFEQGDATFPLEPGEGVACGNAVPLPGAFRVSGRTPMTVCLVWGDGPVDRESIRRQSPASLPRARCTTLTPAPE